MFTLGAGYSTLDGITGMGSISQQNLFGMGYIVTLRGEISTERQDFTLSFTNPWLFDRPINFGFDVYNLDRTYYDDYDQKTRGAAIRLGHPIIRRKLYANYRLEYDWVDIYNLDDDVSYYIKEQRGKATTISFTPSLVWNTLNHPVDPSGGNKSTFSMKFAGGPLQGDYDFINTELTSFQYFPLFWSFVGLLRGEIGYLKSTSGKKLPIDERYRLGGMYTIRGYKDGDVSPKDSEGHEYGGNKYLLFSGEVTFPIVESAKIKGVIFFDAGQSYAEGDTYFSSMRESAGFGIRWFSPLGPLRLEYGRKLNPKKDESSGRWDFSIGGLF